jgi:hypothetical protein
VSFTASRRNGTIVVGVERQVLIEAKGAIAVCGQ